jgi:hypothetical protein
MLLAMELPLIAQAETAAVRLDAVWMLAAVLGVAGWLARRRLPPGIGPSLIVTALTGAALVTGAAGRDEAVGRAWLGHILTALAVGWYVLGRAVRRWAVKSDRRPAANQPELWQQVLLQAAVVCGLAAAANAVTFPAHAPTHLSGAVIDLLLLLLLAAACSLDDGRYARYALLAVLGCLVASWVPGGWLQTHHTVIILAMVAVAVAALLAVLVTVLTHWAYRRRVWMEDPPRLMDAPARHVGVYRLVIAGCGLVGLGGVLLPTAGLTPLALVLSALVCLTVGHRRGSDGTGELGMVLLALGIVTAGSAWVRLGWGGALLGCALAGAYLLWLARFWEQQLLEGRPWTTAGRLIPVARRVGCVAAPACLGLAVGVFLSADTPTGRMVWRPAVAAVLCLLLASMLTHDAATHGSVAAAVGACLAATAAVVPAQQLLAELAGVNVSAVTLVAMVGLLLAVRTAAEPAPRGGRAVFASFSGAAVPAAAFLGLVVRAADSQAVLAAGVGGVALIVTVVTEYAHGRTAVGRSPNTPPRG